MTKKDILELKRRLKKNECTFTKLTGCYVDGEKNIILHINETFLNLEDEEFYKYLEIAKKTLSGTLGNNILELNFPLDEEIDGGRQQSLLALRESKLKNESLLESFYQHIINTYDYTGNYLILIYHDAYDVITKTSDNAKLDESEEVYEYLLCAICPVSLSKPGLGYLEEDNRIGVRIRDWVVDAPETGFVFPAFSDRSSDIHSVLYYTKNAKEPHPEFMEAGLGCPSKQTATEQKNEFQSIIRRAIGTEDEKNNHMFMEIQESLNNMIGIEEEDDPKEKEPILLTKETIQEVLLESNIPEDITEKIEKSYSEAFKDQPPIVDHLIDAKVLAANEQRKKELKLVQQVNTLQQIIEESKDKIETINNDVEQTTNYDNPDFDVILKVKPEKVEQIKSQVINGQKCIVIPIEENEQATVNGINTIL